jgi:hypothetical protein
LPIFYQAWIRKTSFGIKNKEKKQRKEDKTIKLLDFTASIIKKVNKVKKNRKKLCFLLTVLFISL